MKELTTRKEIDAEIQRLQHKLAGLPEDANGLIWATCDRINDLKTMREFMARPWEKARPAKERSLMSFGVV